jgi:RNA polymerase sigma-70 factor (ECF subfamily)
MAGQGSEYPLQTVRTRRFGASNVATVAAGVLQLEASLSTGGSVAYARSMGVTPEDSALMLRYKDGDVTAFETLYRRHNDSLYRYLLRLSLDRDTAEDIFQDVWGKIIKARHRYRPTAKFTTFLYRVAHNCFIDYVRRNNRHMVRSAMDPDCSPDPGDEPDLKAEKSIARRRLDAALGTLPDEQRDAFLLREEAGLSIDSIAQVTGVNRETVKSRLRYANRKLKTALAEPAIQTQRTA